MHRCDTYLWDNFELATKRRNIAEIYSSSDKVYFFFLNIGSTKVDQKAVLNAGSPQISE